MRYLKRRTEEEITTGSIQGATEASPKVKVLVRVHPVKNRGAPLLPIRGKTFSSTYESLDF